MNEAGAPPSSRIRTLIEGLTAATAASTGKAGDDASIRRIAGALAAAAAAEGLEELAERARSVSVEEEDTPSAARELAEYCAYLGRLSPRGTCHLLVVDDDPESRALIRAALASPAHVIHEAETADEARATLTEVPVELIVLDLHLPDEDGRDMLVELRGGARSGHVPVVVLSGEEGAMAPAECYALGADAFISKPPDLGLLRSTVMRHLGRRPEDPAGAPRIGAGEPDRPGRGVEDGPAGRASGEAPRVLVVEDDDVAAMLIEHRLKKAGVAVVRFDDGREGFEAVRSSPFDLVILDIKLPGMDGFDFLRQLRESGPRKAPPVIVLSGLDDESAVVRALELGADDYLSKPFSPPELMARVRRLLGSRL